MARISEKGTAHNVEGVPEEVQRVFVTAHDVSPEWHVKMQAAFQLHTDNAVSKTVNFEEHASREDIEKTYYLAYKSNLKGITVYRNNSRSFQPMNIEKKEVKAPVQSVSNKSTDIKDEDMMVAALIATIDYANETKKDVRLVSIKQIG